MKRRLLLLALVGLLCVAGNIRVLFIYLMRACVRKCVCDVQGAGRKKKMEMTAYHRRPRTTWELAGKGRGRMLKLWKGQFTVIGNCILT